MTLFKQKFGVIQTKWEKGERRADIEEALRVLTTYCQIPVAGSEHYHCKITKSQHQSEQDLQSFEQANTSRVPSYQSFYNLAMYGGGHVSIKERRSEINIYPIG